MRAKLFSGLLFTSIMLVNPVYATLHERLANTSKFIKSCQYVLTGSGLDLALINEGYFVLKRADSDKTLYTRFGLFEISKQDEFVTLTGEKLQAIDLTDPFNTLKNFEISDQDMPAKATDKINATFNLDAASAVNKTYRTDTNIYDALGNAHVLTMNFTKLSANNTWKIVIQIDNQVYATEQLVFDREGRLERPYVSHKFDWESPQGAQHVTIFFKNASQYPTPFKVGKIYQNGYESARILGFSITLNGELSLSYSNGLRKKTGLSTAIATFKHAEQLKQTGPHLYEATDASGPADVQPANSYKNVIAGYLEESCDAG